MTDKEHLINHLLMARNIRGYIKRLQKSEVHGDYWKGYDSALNDILSFIDSMDEESVISNVNVEPTGVPAGVVELANVPDRKEYPISEEYHLTGIGEPRKATGTLGKMIAEKITASGTTLNDFEKRFDEIIKPYRHSRNYEKLCVNLAVWKLNLFRWVLTAVNTANKYLEPNERGFPYNNPAETLQEDIRNVWRNLSVKGLFTATEEGFADVALHFANWNKKYQEPVSEELEKAADQYVRTNLPSGPDVSWSMVMDAMRQAYIAGVKDMFEEGRKPVIKIKEDEINK